MKEISTKRIVKLAAVAALYVALTVGLSGISYGSIQFRIAEAMTLLCFYRKDYCISLTIGCLIANIFSPMALMDMVFGTLATLGSVLVINKSKNLFAASLAPVIFNALIVGLELKIALSLPFVISALEVAAGEFVCVSIIGTAIFKLFEKNERFMDLITD